MVVRWPAKAATVSPGGIDAAVRPGSRVATSDWATPGTVSSRPTRAAAAASDPTPGTISQSRPAARHQSICSCTAEYSATSPECRRTTRAGAGWAAYTASTSSSVMPAESCTTASARAWHEHLLGHERRRPHHDVGAGQPVGRPQGEQVGGARTGAHEGDHAPPVPVWPSPLRPRTGGTTRVAR